MSAPRYSPSNGFTLIQLLIVLAIIGTSLLVLAPSFSRIIADAHSRTAMHHMQSTLAYARYAAVTRTQPVTICAIDPANVCTRDWNHHHRIVVFIDSNNNHRLDAGETLLRQATWPLESGEISWRASLARTYITFRSDGASWQNGTLYYCESGRDVRHARALVLNQSGRSYLSRDSNNDGIREDRHGRNLTC
jgi:type IV fimbrial biogenesis protein FimT